MDISVPQINTAGLIRPTNVTTTPPAASPPASPPAPAANTGASGDAYEQAAKEALASFNNTYAVSDKKFAIFKDASGQLITRYVSLRDGSVTYVPAPKYIKPTALITIRA